MFRSNCLTCGQYHSGVYKKGLRGCYCYEELGHMRNDQPESQTNAIVVSKDRMLERNENVWTLNDSNQSQASKKGLGQRQEGT